MKAKGATDMKRTFLAGLALCLALPCMAEEEATEILKSGRVIITAFCSGRFLICRLLLSSENHSSSRLCQNNVSPEE